MKVLWVEDDTDYVKLVSRKLEDYGMQIRWCETFDEAIDAATEELPEVVLLDLGLGDRRGLSTLQEFLAYKFAVPIVILSASDCVDIERSALMLGAEDCLPKDKVDAYTIYRVLDRACFRFKSKQLALELQDISHAGKTAVKKLEYAVEMFKKMGVNL